MAGNLDVREGLHVVLSGRHVHGFAKPFPTTRRVTSAGLMLNSG